MIELILATGILGYIIIYVMEAVLSGKTFEKIIYHSKVTEIIAIAISSIAMFTIIIGTITFTSVIILSIIQSGLFVKTIEGFNWGESAPPMHFAMIIGFYVIICLPVGLIKVLPFYGAKNWRN